MRIKKDIESLLPTEGALEHGSVLYEFSQDSYMFSYDPAMDHTISAFLSNVFSTNGDCPEGYRCVNNMIVRL